MSARDGEPDAVLVVRAEMSGSHLLELLSTHLINQSKTRLRRLIGTGHIRLNGAHATPRAVVREGDSVSLPAELGDPTIPQQSVRIDVLYEDDSLLCVDKPAGHSVLPGRGGHGSEFFHSLVAFLNRRASPGGPYVRPHIVHRLDRETSGVLLVAKTVEAGRRLSRQFEQRQVDKRYLGLCEGALPRPELSVEVPLGREPGSILRMTTDPRRGKPATTLLRIRERFGHFSLLDIRPLTGRQHQVRVHLAAIGYPLAADVLYGRRDRLCGADLNAILGRPAAADDAPLLERCPLHAASLRCRHPRTDEPMVHESPLPEDMRRLVELLGRVDPPQ
jgi:23S rRNA pseudouridine1911/1915/1917 synthase